MLHEVINRTSECRYARRRSEIAESAHVEELLVDGLADLASGGEAVLRAGAIRLHGFEELTLGHCQRRQGYPTQVVLKQRPESVENHVALHVYLPQGMIKLSWLKIGVMSQVLAPCCVFLKRSYSNICYRYTDSA